MPMNLSVGSIAYQVHALIAAQHIANADRFARDYPNSIYYRTCTDPLESLNRYWRAQITNVSSLDGTAAARNAHETLTYSEDFGAYLANFQRYVLPLVLRFDLPSGGDGM